MKSAAMAFTLAMSSGSSSGLPNDPLAAVVPIWPLTPGLEELQDSTHEGVH